MSPRLTYSHDDTMMLRSKYKVGFVFYGIESIRVAQACQRRSRMIQSCHHGHGAYRHSDNRGLPNGSGRVTLGGSPVIRSEIHTDTREPTAHNTYG